jgi:hypothetical protein
MPITAELTASQGLVCTEATYTDNTDYTAENVPAQRTAYVEIVPPGTSGKTNVPLTFTSGSTIVNLNVAILSGDTVAQRCTKITAALQGNATIAAIVTAVDGTTKVTVTADNPDVAFTITQLIETGSDLLCTITDFPFSTRTLTFEYSDGTEDVVNFPFVIGQGDTYDLTGLTKDYCIKTTLTITPQIEVIGSTYESIIYPVFTCNVLTAKGVIASDFIINMQDLQCSTPKLNLMSQVDALISGSDYAASVGDISGAQALLDQANNIVA